MSVVAEAPEDCRPALSEAAKAVAAKAAVDSGAVSPAAVELVVTLEAGEETGA